MLDPKETALYESFKSGDLLYGMDRCDAPMAVSRLTFLPALKEKVGADYSVIVDDLNNQMLQPSRFDYDGYKTLSEEEFNALSKQARQHYNYLTTLSGINEKYKPQKAVEKDYESMDNVALRRACQITLLDSTRHKHVVLDGIDMERVARKGCKEGKYWKIDRKITPYEIRFLVKHWDEIKSHTTVYLNGEPLQELPLPSNWNEIYKQKPEMPNSNRLRNDENEACSARKKLFRKEDASPTSSPEQKQKKSKRKLAFASIDPNNQRALATKSMLSFFRTHASQQPDDLPLPQLTSEEPVEKENMQPKKQKV